MTRFATLLAATAIAAVATGASAAPITEVEGNNTIATAQFIPATEFTLPVPATVFNPPGFATATVMGSLAVNDVDFFAFTTSANGNAYFDIDNAPVGLDTTLSLFNSIGTLIGYGDDPGSADPGSASSSDAFLGVFELPGPGTYYLAVSSFPLLPSALLGPLTVTSLPHPDGTSEGGLRIGAAPAGVSSFFSGGGNSTSGPYTLYVSAQGAAQVPEPITMLLVGAGLAASAVRSRRARR